MGDAHRVPVFLERIFSPWMCDLNKPLGVFRSRGLHLTGTFTCENSSGEYAKLAGDCVQWWVENDQDSPSA